MKEKFSVTGMTCSACSSGIERRVGKLDGVKKAEVSLLGESMTIDYDEAVINTEEIVNTVLGLGYGIQPFEEGIDSIQKSQSGDLKKRFLRSLVLLFPLVYLSMGEMFGAPVPNILVNYVLQALLSACIIVVNFKFFTVGAKAVFYSF